MKYLVFLTIFLSVCASSNDNCLTSSQIKEQVKNYLKIAEPGYEAKYKFESHLEMLNVYGLARGKLDPARNAETIHMFDRLSNATMRLVESGLQFVEDYDLNYKNKMERVLALHYANRDSYSSVEGDENLISLSKAVGYNNASHEDYR